MFSWWRKIGPGRVLSRTSVKYMSKHVSRGLGAGVLASKTFGASLRNLERNSEERVQGVLNPSLMSSGHKRSTTVGRTLLAACGLQ